MIKLLGLLLFCNSLPLLAAEVVTLDHRKATNEIVVILTDNNLQSEMEKHFVARACRLQFGMNTIVSSVRENRFHPVCRAEVIQFFLSKGYKPSMDYKVFSRN